jgi:hypothetical protein
MKVKMIEEDAVVVFDVQTGQFGQTTTYYANLSKQKHYYIEDDNEVELDWEECFEHIEDHIEDFIKDVTTRYYNNINVMGSYRKSGNEKLAAKAERHKERNEKLLEILEKYREESE